MDQALTPKQVAERLQVGIRVTMDLLRSGEIPARKVGGQWRVSPRALDEYLRGDVDDEPMSPQELANLQDGIEEIKRGDTVPLEEYERERSL